MSKNKNAPMDTDEQKAKFRQSLTFFRSGWLCGDDLPDAIDESIHRLLCELTGENMCHMDLRHVNILPVEMPHIAKDKPGHMQYVVTVLAEPARGYPRHAPQSRAKRRRIDEAQKENEERVARHKERMLQEQEHDAN